MDPFTLQSDSWRVQNELLRLQQVQADQGDRLSRLERRQEDDARMKSVWGGTSPFPSVLSGTPQQAPLQQPPTDHFKDFDDESSNLIGSLHLDAEEEPRRIGATSRANSVRFDESANQGHWAHPSRAALEYVPRNTTGFGGLPMNERSSSHKSDGRASSVHSVRSAVSMRANSLNLETGFGLGDSNRSPLDTPGLAPGLILLGSVPAIIRCWMNTNFKHDALLYAAVCTGSHRSSLDIRLIRKLGFQDRINIGPAGVQTIELPVYFPEAVSQASSSRSSSPIPQLPTLTVVFTVHAPAPDASETKAIQIMLGSDILRAHNADILFSSGRMTLFDDERNKLSIPLVRPEDEATFSSLHITSDPLHAVPYQESDQGLELEPAPVLSGLGQSTQELEGASYPLAPTPPAEKYRAPGTVTVENQFTPTGASEVDRSSSSRPTSRDASFVRPSTGHLTGPVEAKETDADSSPSRGAPSRSGSTPAIWNNWRRDGGAASTQTASPSANQQFDWGSGGKKQDNGYQRRDTGIKVLKPMKTTARTFSSSSAASSSPADGRSKFFDDGKRRNNADVGHDEVKAASGIANEGKLSLIAKENQPVGNPVSGARTRANPAGGASAFAWLNQSGSRA